MNDPNRLSQIETLWSMVYHAHEEDTLERQSAQSKLLELYGAAIQRYLLGALRDQAAADDAYQDFAVKFLRGDFHRANQEKGRFRNFLKVILGRLVTDFHRRKVRRPELQLGSQFEVPAEIDDSEFLEIWRDQTLKQTWRRLAEEETRSGKPWMTVLKLRVENPQMSSTDLAQRLSEKINEPVTATRLRVLLHRARERFSGYLVECVSSSLPQNTAEAIEDELAQLELLQYCQPFLDKKKSS